MKAEHPFSKKWISLPFFYPQTLLKTKTNKLIRTHATERLGATFKPRRVQQKQRRKKQSPTAPKQKQNSLHSLPAGRNFLKASTLTEDTQVGVWWSLDLHLHTPTAWHFICRTQQPLCPAQVGPREKPGRVSGKRTSPHCCGAWAAECGQGRGAQGGERAPGASGKRGRQRERWPMPALPSSQRSPVSDRWAPAAIVVC